MIGLVVLLALVWWSVGCVPLEDTTVPVTPTHVSGLSIEDQLSWRPPQLQNPVTVQIPAGDPNSPIVLDPALDYILQMPDEPVTENLSIRGGNHVVLIGGEINIGWQGDGADITERTGLKLFDMLGTVHIEGLLIHGEDLSEGIQIDAPQAVVQIQNVAVIGAHARDQQDFTDNHPDLIQTYGNMSELRVDRFTGSSDYQGLFFKTDSNGPHNSVYLSRVNLIGLPTARYLLWIGVVSWENNQAVLNDWGGIVSLDDIWIDVPEERDRGLADAVWPPAHFDFPTQAQMFRDVNGYLCASWSPEMSAHVRGYVCEGVPPEGDFVRAEDVGIGYVSPGYRTEE
jgi:hypothetical protein